MKKLYFPIWSQSQSHLISNSCSNREPIFCFRVVMRTSLMLQLLSRLFCSITNKDVRIFLTNYIGEPIQSPRYMLETFIWCVRKISQNVTHASGYQGVRNVSFSKYFAYVLKEWSLCKILLSAKFTEKHLWSGF